MLFKKSTNFFRRAAFICTEILVMAAVLLMLAAIGFIWRIKTAPLDIDFAKSYIEEALKNQERGAYAKIDSIVLHWPDLGGPLLLGLHGAKIFNAEDKLVIFVDEVALSLSKSHLLTGKISPLSLSLRKPELRVIRMEDNKIDIGFGMLGDETGIAIDQVQDIEEQTNLTARIFEYIAAPGMKDDGSPLATLRSFEIQQARVIIEDQVMGVLWNFPRVDAVFKSVDEGIEADISIDLPVGEVATSSASLHTRFLVERESKQVKLQADITNLDFKILADKIPDLAEFKDQNITLNGGLTVVLGPDLVPLTGQIFISSAQGDLSIPELYSDRLSYKDFVLEAAYDSEKKHLYISNFGITARDVTVSTSAEFNFTENKISGPVKILIDELLHDNIAPLWPKFLKGDNSEKWIVERLSSGVIKNLTAEMNLTAEKQADGWDFDISSLDSRFSFEGMSADYRPPMIPVTNTKGTGSFNLETEKLSVDVESASIADLEITSAHLEFTNIIKAGSGIADIDVKLKGPVKTGIEYVSLEPISLKHDFDLNQVKGKADITVNVVFPTVKDIKIKDVKITVTGTLNDVFLPDVLRDLDLSGGPMNISVKDNEFSLEGKGKLADRPITLNYKEFLSSKDQKFKNTVTAQITADQNLRKHLGVDLSEFLEGSVPVNVTYTEFAGGRSEANVEADLTPARLFADPFDYEKPAGTKGAATLKIVLQNQELKEIYDLEASAPAFQLDKTRLLFRQKGNKTELEQGSTGRFVIGETISALDFEVEKSGRYKIVLEGPVLDLRPFIDDEKKENYDSPPMLISIAVDRMLTADNETVEYGKIYADIDSQGRFNQLEMDAIAGSGDIYLRYKPDESGKRVFRFEADDAGAALKAFSIYDKIRSGKMVIYGEPIHGIYDRNLLGLAEITNFKVVDAPTLARLLSVMSLPGLIGALDNDGLVFTKLEAKFDWLYRQNGSLLVLKDGRTSGNSLGLTFDGTFDKSAGTLDVSGTLVPLSGINSIISSIPLIGDILTGGTGSIFAATYKAKGKISDPEISVNPLSVLAPGILRRILFE